MIQIQSLFFFSSFTVLQLLTIIHLQQNTLKLISGLQKVNKNYD